jgi:hypothetical protein
MIGIIHSVVEGRISRPGVSTDDPAVMVKVFVESLKIGQAYSSLLF